ncbi:hypothetical protein ABAC460_10090 [Asticcacaulis sp. AC460]|uniref:hypothetical protein n=1 Tax=Asticcacaulis sp. AC460 TaxID=1282360 RepID=UPI0003C3B6E9|nr:hypothetical protein [Asticcacaulis sp. AC460]ESQ90107.1 hypothetical protein ABAC460_10090 [Asticcacaulis sp. AC460]
MSRKIYAFGYAFCVAHSAVEACAKMGMPPHSHVTDVTWALSKLCETVLGPDTFAPPSKPIFFGAERADRTYMHALGAVGVVTGDKEAIDEVARLVKFEQDAKEEIAGHWAEIERIGNVSDSQFSDNLRLEEKLAQANARIAELEAAAKETNDRLVWQAEKQAMALETPAAEPVIIEATPLTPLAITDPTPDPDEWAHLDRILRADWPADVPFATIRDTVAQAGYVMNDQAIRNRAIKLGLRRTNPTAMQGHKSPAKTEATPPQALPPETSVKGGQPTEVSPPGITPPATASRLAKLIGAEAIRLRDELMNPDEIAKALNTTLGRNDQVTARQVTQVLAEMQRLQRAFTITE